MSDQGTRTHGVEPTALLIAAVEFVLLLGLWMLFVSLLQTNEFVAGMAAALLGAIADAVVKATDFARFRPRFRHVLLVFVTPWYVVRDTVVVFWVLAKKLAGVPLQSSLKVIPFAAGEDSVEDNARRALATGYSTISPNTIVLGIDCERNLLLLHEISPSETSWMLKQLGARE